MNRYTRNMLEQDLQTINQKISSTGYYLAAQGRNGYTGIDEYQGDASEGTAGRCIRNIECGTPRQCFEAAKTYAGRI